MALVLNSFTEFRVAKLAIGAKLPAVRTITTSAVVTAGATTIPVTALPLYLQAGRSILFTGQSTPILIAADAAQGATSISVGNVGGVPVGLNSGVNATTYELFSYLAGEAVNMSVNDNVISVRNFRSGPWSESVKIMIGASFEVSGQFDTADRAISNVIRPASFAIGDGTQSPEVYCEVVRPNGDTYKGAFLVSGYSETGELDNVLRVSFTMSSQGAVGIPTPLLLTQV